MTVKIANLFLPFKLGGVAAGGRAADLIVVGLRIRLYLRCCRRYAISETLLFSALERLA